MGTVIRVCRVCNHITVNKSEICNECTKVKHEGDNNPDVRLQDDAILLLMGN